MKRNVRSHARVVTALLVGVLVGILLLGPSGAHIGTNITHLWGAPGHLKAKVKNFGDTLWAKKNHNHDRTYYSFDRALPQGKTIRGAWLASDASDELTMETVISYPVPLGFEPIVITIAPGGGSVPDTCGGSSQVPQADPGYLCIFATEATNFSDSLGFHAFAPEVALGCASGSQDRQCRLGVIIRALKSAPGFGEIYGTYAVRAPV